MKKDPGIAAGVAEAVQGAVARIEGHCKKNQVADHKVFVVTCHKIGQLAGHTGPAEDPEAVRTHHTVVVDQHCEGRHGRRQPVLAQRPGFAAKRV